MKEVKRKFELLLTKDERNKAIKDIISYYLNERDVELDIIEANALLDTFLQDIAPSIYNKAIDDTKKLFKKKSEDFDIELDLLKSY